jgi:hypothetical protein
MTPKSIKFDETVAINIRVGGRDAALVGLDERNKDIGPILFHIRNLISGWREEKTS